MTFYKGNWPRAARKIFIRLFVKEETVMKTFSKGNWPRAARKFFIMLFVKRKAVIKTFIKKTGRAQRGNFLKSESTSH